MLPKEKEIYNCMVIPSAANWARFYALPEIHKPTFDDRPNVSNVGTAAYTFARFL